MGSEIPVVGSIVMGSHGAILVRQRSGCSIELGDLLVIENGDGSRHILQVYDLEYGSQLSQKNLELLSGMKLEGFTEDLGLIDPSLRNYVLVKVKSVASVTSNGIRIPKTLPTFMSEVRAIKEEDLKFTKPPKPIFLGKVRSGSKILNIDVFLDGDKMFRHHVLIPATTGRGKSNLVKVMLWSVLGQAHFGILVLDPHDEYYGRHEKGLKDHPKAKGNLIYYSPTPPPGANTLIINLKSIEPSHFDGIVAFTQAQEEAVDAYYNRFGKEWITQIVKEEPIDTVHPKTITVLRRKLEYILDVYLDKAGKIQCRSGVFSDSAGQHTVRDMVSSLEKGKIVVIDTSRLLDQAELLIGSIIANSIFRRYQQYKSEGTLEDKPVINIVVEEAPRVLGIDVLQRVGDNIYSIIAREGRKFKVGLTAITQLTSVIPREILANMNTKIILGNELASERQAIISSASQDLSTDDKNIASLDIGEAIVSSNFTKFAIPIQIPDFNELASIAQLQRKKEKTGFV
jgi:uncharacterized protein